MRYHLPLASLTYARVTLRLPRDEPLRNHYRQWRGTQTAIESSDNERRWQRCCQPTPERAIPDAASLSSASLRPSRSSFHVSPFLSLSLSLFRPFSHSFSLNVRPRKRRGPPCRLHNRPTPAGQPLDPDSGWTRARLPLVKASRVRNPAPARPEGVEEEKVSSRPLPYRLAADRRTGGRVVLNTAGTSARDDG